MVPAEGDHVAVVGENRKLLVFPLDQVPHLARGKGMRLQRYKDGGLSDAKVFTLAEGLTWRDTSGKAWTVSAADLRDWMGNRAEAGRLPPQGLSEDEQVRGLARRLCRPMWRMGHHPGSGIVAMMRGR